ncbi:hypothetical protein ATZ36_08860 [Candidatus Endomicrobiellum trichonymphae]|uniref:Uncharacterized protein n=1 Tax=Endomicrobium trichonymphae TaxID=1408204 RepID=A0A1E5IGN5_ENDTX|nr:hypothetical protein ATZ36_08860 [Candidatus Endomicrobium trichonymphae]
MRKDFSLRFLNLSFKLFNVILPPLLNKAAPKDTKKCALLGKNIFSGFNFNDLIKQLRSSDKKKSGPPRKHTFPLIACPLAKPPIVWLTTACKMLAAISSFAAPSFKSGIISAFAKTPHLAAIG